MAAPLPKILDARGQSFRVQAEAKHIHLPLQKMFRHPLGQNTYRLVRQKQGPMPVDCKGGMRVVSVQQGFNHASRGGKFRRFQPSLAVNGRISGGNQYPVARPQRHVQMFDQTQNHVAARHRAPPFKKTSDDAAKSRPRPPRIAG